MAREAKRRWMILAVVGVSQVMVFLDMTVVNIAMPSAQRALHFSNDDSVFTRHGGYGSPQDFVDRLCPALWIAGGLSVAGIVAALLAPRRLREVVPAGMRVAAAEAD